MAFCSLPCWTYFSAALRAFCLLNPKPNAISVQLQPGLVNSFHPRETVSLKRRKDNLSLGRWPCGQGQLYDPRYGTAWLLRVTERECTKDYQGNQRNC